MTNEAKSKVEQYLEDRRSTLKRVLPSDAFHRISDNPNAAIIDTRPSSYRESEGSIPGAIIIERNVLEWRLDPSSPHNIPEARQEGFEPIIMCNEGYASSLAARVLQDIGLDKATDLEGGFRRWKAEGFPVQQGLG